jgi:hypothetical protein
MANLYLDTALANLAAERTNSTYLADRVLPIMPTAKQQGKIYVLDPEKRQFIPLDNVRAPGGEPYRFARSQPSTVTYNAQDHSLEGFIADEDRLQYDPALIAEVNQLANVQDNIQLKREGDLVAGIVTNVTQTSSPGTKWDAAGGDIIGDIKSKMSTIRDSVGKTPNALAIPATVLELASKTAAWKQNIIYAMTPEQALQMGLAGQLQAMISTSRESMVEVLVADSYYNSAAAGQTASFTSIWGENTLLFRKEPPSLQSANLGQHMVWTGEPGSAGGFVVERERVAKRKGDAIYVHHYYDQVFLNAGAGYLFTNTLT